jgi:hypothetical protein
MLDRLTPARHIVSVVADGAALTAAEMAATYTAAQGDTSRVIGYEPDVHDELEANRWLTERAIEDLARRCWNRTEVLARGARSGHDVPHVRQGPRHPAPAVVTRRWTGSDVRAVRVPRRPRHQPVHAVGTGGAGCTGPEVRWNSDRHPSRETVRLAPLPCVL